MVSALFGPNSQDCGQNRPFSHNYIFNMLNGIHYSMKAFSILKKYIVQAGRAAEKVKSNSNNNANQPLSAPNKYFYRFFSLYISRRHCLLCRYDSKKIKSSVFKSRKYVIHLLLKCVQEVQYQLRKVEQQ